MEVTENTVFVLNNQHYRAHANSEIRPIKQLAKDIIKEYVSKRDNLTYDSFMEEIDNRIYNKLKETKNDAPSIPTIIKTDDEQTLKKYSQYFTQKDCIIELEGDNYYVCDEWYTREVKVLVEIAISQGIDIQII